MHDKATTTQPTDAAATDGPARTTTTAPCMPTNEQQRLNHQVEQQPLPSLRRSARTSARVLQQQQQKRPQKPPATALLTPLPSPRAQPTARSAQASTAGDPGSRATLPATRGKTSSRRATKRVRAGTNRESTSTMNTMNLSIDLSAPASPSLEPKAHNTEQRDDSLLAAVHATNGPSTEAFDHAAMDDELLVELKSTQDDEQIAQPCAPLFVVEISNASVRAQADDFSQTGEQEGSPAAATLRPTPAANNARSSPAASQRQPHDEDELSWESDSDDGDSSRKHGRSQDNERGGNQHHDPAPQVASSSADPTVIPTDGAHELSRNARISLADDIRERSPGSPFVDLHTRENTLPPMSDAGSSSGTLQREVSSDEPNFNPESERSFGATASSPGAGSTDAVRFESAEASHISARPSYRLKDNDSRRQRPRQCTIWQQNYDNGAEVPPYVHRPSRDSARAGNIKSTYRQPLPKPKRDADYILESPQKRVRESGPSLGGYQSEVKSLLSREEEHVVDFKRIIGLLKAEAMHESEQRRSLCLTAVEVAVKFFDWEAADKLFVLTSRPWHFHEVLPILRGYASVGKFSDFQKYLYYCFDPAGDNVPRPSDLLELWKFPKLSPKLKITQPFAKIIVELVKGIRTRCSSSWMRHFRADPQLRAFVDTALSDMVECRMTTLVVEMVDILIKWSFERGREANDFEPSLMSASIQQLVLNYLMDRGARQSAMSLLEFASVNSSLPVDTLLDAVARFAGVDEPPQSQTSLKAFELVRVRPVSDMNVPKLEDVIDFAVSASNLDLCLAVFDLMGSNALEPSSWDVVLPPLKLAVAWDKLISFMKVFYPLLPRNSNAIVPRHVISEVIAACAAAPEPLCDSTPFPLRRHALWCFMYLRHHNLRRIRRDHANLLHLILSDSHRGNESVADNDQVLEVIRDMLDSRFSFTPNEAASLIDILVQRGDKSGDWSALLLALIDISSIDRLKGNQAYILDVVVNNSNGYKADLACAIIESAQKRDPNGLWADPTSWKTISKLFETSCGQAAYPALVTLLRGIRQAYCAKQSGRHAPTRKLCGQLFQQIESAASISKKAARTLAINVFGWGVECNVLAQNTCGRGLPGKIDLHDCFSFTEMSLTFLYAVEHLCRNAREAIRHREYVVVLPKYIERNRLRIPTQQIAKTFARQLANCELFTVPLQARVAEPGESGTMGYGTSMPQMTHLVVNSEALICFANEVLDGHFRVEDGPQPVHGSIMNAFADIEKTLEGGSLLFSNARVPGGGSATGRRPSGETLP
ncbi:hypothetical protein DFJ73DRAFT_792209, partial [Zopfochytrium polystomum]